MVTKGKTALQEEEVSAKSICLNKTLERDKLVSILSFFCVCVEIFHRCNGFSTVQAVFSIP